MQDIRSISEAFVLNYLACLSEQQDGFSDDNMCRFLVSRICQEEGDLQMEEFDDIWNKAPKFPDAEAPNERIDVDSFVQIYRDIDDLFEDDDDDADEDRESTTAPPSTSDTKNAIERNNRVEVNAENEASKEDELEAIFRSICDMDGFLSKQQLIMWDEVKNLLDEGLLGKNELEALWDKAPKRDNKIEMTGFLSFNRELDGLFDFEDEEGEFVEGIEEEDLDDVDQSELSPEELFSAIAGPDGFVGKEDLSRWSELQEMISDGELTPSELEELYIKNAGDKNKLDQEAFTSLFKAIDDLFEEFDDDNEDEAQRQKPTLPSAETAQAPNAQVSEAKSTLLRALEILNSDEERLRCGLEATPDEQKRIRNIVELLESEPTNIIRIKKGAIATDDLAGNWELLYSSSSAMKFNKGLSGLGGSFPNGKFGGLEQKLIANKFMTDVEYTEHIDAKPSSASFDVKVTGGWELRQSVSLFTGEPSTVLTVEPERVTYGPTSTRADHWKSLGPMNMLDVAYLDDSLRIMRGNTSVETIFIFRRV